MHARPGKAACRHGEENTAPMREVGYADDVVRNEREARFVDRDDYVPLINGQVLRIVPHRPPRRRRRRRRRLQLERQPPRHAQPRPARHQPRDGEGDACECLGVTCAASDACHVAGTCNPATGLRPTPAAPDGAASRWPTRTALAPLARRRVLQMRASPTGDANAANGCETATRTSPTAAPAPTVHRRRPRLPTCAGSCALTLRRRLAGDADGDRANGCEPDITTDAHCGRPATPASERAPMRRHHLRGGRSARRCAAAAGTATAPANGCGSTPTPTRELRRLRPRLRDANDGTPACAGGVARHRRLRRRPRGLRRRAAADGREVNTPPTSPLRRVRHRLPPSSPRRRGSAPRAPAPSAPAPRARPT